MFLHRPIFIAMKMTSQQPPTELSGYIPPSALAERFLRLNGKPYSLKNREAMRRAVMDNNYKFILIYGGRQIEKSTTFAAKMLTLSIAAPGIRIAYVTAFEGQKNRFANSVLKPFMRTMNPSIKRYYLPSDVFTRTYFFELNNGSRAYVEYLGTTGDRLRGISLDMVFLDEVQDALYEAILVLDEALSHANPEYVSLGMRHYAGTPKTVEHPIQYYWDISTQTQPVIKCEHCGRYNGDDDVLDEKNVGSEGLVCRYCGKPLDPTKVIWVNSYELEDTRPVMGFRYPKLIAPHLALHPEAWRTNVYDKMLNVPIHIFRNETLALPSDNVTRALTEEDLRSVSLPNVPLDLKLIEKYYKPQGYRPPVTMGIDWGGGNRSYTVLALTTVYSDGGLITYALKRFVGPEANREFIVDFIKQLVGIVHPNYIFVDAGYSQEFLPPLREALGKSRITTVYFSHSLKKQYTYDRQANAFTVNRTQVLSQLFYHIRNGDHYFPRWGEFEPFARDFRALYIDTLPNGKTYYNHYPGKPTDAAFATLLSALPFYIYGA